MIERKRREGKERGKMEAGCSSKLPLHFSHKPIALLISLLLTRHYMRQQSFS